MSSLFGSPKMPSVAPAVAPPTTTDPTVQAAAQQDQATYAAAAGRASTILTSGQGTAPPTVARKTLLGG